MRRSLFLVPLLLVSLLFLTGCGDICRRIGICPEPLPEEPYAAPFDPEAITIDPATGAEIVSNQVIVRFREGVDGTTAEAVIAGLGCIIVGEAPMFNVYQLRIPDGAHPADLVAQFERSPHVQWAQVSYIARLNAPTGIASEPDDPYKNPLFRDQWALHNTGQSGGTVDADIDAPEAWEIEKGHPSVTIAILDTGVNYNHEDLRDNLRMDRDRFVWDQIDFDRSPMDEEGHGTEMAGVAVASMNDKGIVGVAPYATFLPVRVLSAGDPTVAPGAATFATSIGMLVAHSRHAQVHAQVIVINMSFGSTGRCRLEEKVVALLSGKNDVLLIASAGNDGSTSEFFPAALPGVMAVAATDHNDQRSVWFPGVWPRRWWARASNYGPWVDVSAPGGSTAGIVHPERLTASTGFPGDKRYEWTGGTSAAAAFVSGVAALIWSLDYRDGDFDLSASQVRDIIKVSADNIDHLNPRYRGNLGTGRVNAYKALLEAARRLGLNQPPEPARGQIAFTSFRDGNWEIYVMNADGTTLRNITNHPGQDKDPAWSPDGTSIAFASNRDDNWEIYVMNADGTNQRNITNHPGVDKDPAWSPDGTRIAFTSTRDRDRRIYSEIYHSEIYVMNADGTNLRRLTNHPGVDQNPAWSPDGTRIAFASKSSHGSVDGEIYVMNADGTNLRNITNHPAWDRDPAWSPDGTRIAFTSSRENYDWEIYVVNADGTNLRNITNHPAHEGNKNPAWSPDGTRIAFDSGRHCTDRGIHEEIYVMNADGTNLRRLTNHPAENFGPAWSPVLP